MPFAFPSHQGLIAPLWRRWPGFFDVPAMFIGAAMPDVVDGIIGLTRGHFGQGVGHSLIAIPLLCIPGGLLIWAVALLASRPLPLSPGRGFFGRIWNAGLRALHDAPGEGSQAVRSLRAVCSMGLGTFSHLLIDLVSHGGFVWPILGCRRQKYFPNGGTCAGRSLTCTATRSIIPLDPIFLFGLSWA